MVIGFTARRPISEKTVFPWFLTPSEANKSKEEKKKKRKNCRHLPTRLEMGFQSYVASGEVQTFGADTSRDVCGWSFQTRFVCVATLVILGDVCSRMCALLNDATAALNLGV